MHLNCSSNYHLQLDYCDICILFDVYRDDGRSVVVVVVAAAAIRVFFSAHHDLHANCAQVAFKLHCPIYSWWSIAIYIF